MFIELLQENFGKENVSPIYEGLDKKGRRNTRKMSEHFHGRRIFYAESFKAVSEKKNLTSDELSNKYYLLFLKNLYERDEADFKNYSDSIEDEVIRRSLSWIHLDNTLKTKVWEDTFSLIQTNPVSKFYLPTLLSERVHEIWTDVKAKRVEAARQADERDKKIREGRVLYWRVDGTTQEVTRGQHVSIFVPGTKKSISERSQSWSSLLNWLGDPNFNTEGVLYVSIDGVGEIRAGTFQSKRLGGVDFDWEHVWRP